MGKRDRAVSDCGYKVSFLGGNPMQKVRKSKPPEQAIEQYTLYHTVVYTCPYCSAQLGGAETNRRPETCPECGQRIAYEEAQ